MATQEMEVAQARLADLVAAAENGNEVLLTREGRPVARLVPALPDRVPGSARGLITMSDDFDAPLEDFADYM